MEISKKNRHSTQDDNGKHKRKMHMDGASVRNIDRIRREREEGAKKRAKGRKRNRYKV